MYNQDQPVDAARRFKRYFFPLRIRLVMNYFPVGPLLWIHLSTTTSAEAMLHNGGGGTGFGEEHISARLSFEVVEKAVNSGVEVMR